MLSLLVLLGGFHFNTRNMREKVQNLMLSAYLLSTRNWWKIKKLLKLGPKLGFL